MSDDDENMQNLEIDIDLMQPVVAVAEPKVYKRDQYVWKETNMYEKRPICMKRDQYVWKETNMYEKRYIK